MAKQKGFRNTQRHIQRDYKYSEKYSHKHLDKYLTHPLVALPKHKVQASTGNRVPGNSILWSDPLCCKMVRAAWILRAPGSPRMARTAVQPLNSSYARRLLLCSHLVCPIPALHDSISNSHRASQASPHSRNHSPL